MRILKSVVITPRGLAGNDEQVLEGNLTGIYHLLGGQYPKFFKMDGLSKLGYLGAEYLLSEIPQEQKERGSVIMFNRSASLTTDRHYQATIQDADNYFPSPALFVYTLANIVTGEIAIRHKIFGETSFYVMQDEDPEMMDNIVEDALMLSDAEFVVAGWLEYENDNEYICKMKLITRN